jgi:hypothetical protein
VHCPRCRTVAEPGDRRCVACGRRFRPWKGWFLTYVVLLGILGAGIWWAGTHLWDAAQEEGRLQQVKDETPKPPKSTTTTTLPPITAPPETTTTVAAADAPILTGVSVTASTTGKPAQNSCQEQTLYDATNVLDGRADTAWRVPGDGIGEELRFALPGPTRLLSVGLIPGYDKVDACSGDDRFPQHRRVTQVLWVFDDGSQVNQVFQDDRSMQVIPVDVVTTSVTMRILGSTPPGVLDYTPISEVQLKGTPAG